ncbi:neural cell adhesion molecule L1.2 isoform X2 [Lepisosteus oculatus]|uniref:neural cell adhesion molecule L1.2 isoform X2 n=1 Tax=Lepisosteus oculatus TaxID=7918 RepID=UPI0035F521F6
MKLQCQRASSGECCLSPLFLFLALFLLSHAPVPSRAVIHIPKGYNKTQNDQPPVITAQSPRNLTAFSSDDITLTCEASGSPSPSFRWVKDGVEFRPSSDHRFRTQPGTGTFSVTAGNGPISEFQGTYRCYADNALGTAMTHETQLVTEKPPKWQKENIVPKVVEEGESVILPCNPPKSIVTPYIHWMDEFLRHIEQNERVTQGRDGNLYFSHVTQKDSRDDYICHAQFISARTILQKEPIKLKVTTTNAMKNRKPSLLLPRGSQSTHMALRGQTLELECIAEGLPTPHLEWERKDGDLSDARASLQSFGKLLRIENVVESDDGEYQCTASNDQGKATHIFTVTVQAAPYWTRVPESGLYAPGEIMRLDCEAEGIPTPTVRWRMNGQWLDEIEKDDRRRVEGGTLILTDVQFGDTAVFQCEASNIHGTILTNTYTHIINLPPQILTESGQVYQLTEGQNAYLPCHAFGSPSPRLIWEHGGESVLSNPRMSQFANGTLNISDVVRGDSGAYICRVENFNISINATLDVFNRTEFEEVPAPLLLQPGEKATFHCVARGDLLFEPLQIVWRKNGRKIFSSDDSDKYTFTKRSLIVTDVELADIGLYTCVAMGKLDTIEASAMLTVVDYPDPPFALQLSDPQSLSVRLSWTPGDNHNSPMQEFVVEYEEERTGQGVWHELTRVPGDSTSAFLDLWPFCTSRFRVIAINKLGKGKPSEPSDSYTTPHAAPDRNPRDVTGEGTSADNMVIRWKDMPATEHGAPGFQYKVMWRQASGEEPKWHENFTESPHYVVTNTPTFTAYEIKVQAVNDLGEGPPASPVIGFSGEDTPVEAPMNVGVEVMDSTTIKVAWSQVPGESVKGHLLGYKIYLKRLGGVEAGSRQKRFSSKRGAGHKAPHGPGGPDFKVVTVSGAKGFQVVSGLRPYSRYTVNMTVFNKIGEGPPSEPFAFSTPEGVPSPPVSLHFDSPTETSLTLHWEPPAQPNGILTGYILQYQKLLDSEVGEMAVSHYQSPLVRNVTLTGLDRERTYRFYLRATTATGEGEPIIRDAATLLEGGPPANISFSAGKTFANFTWVSGERYRNIGFHIHFLNKNGQDPWKVSEKVNSSQAFYQLQGLHPGSQYRLKFISRNDTFWETEIQTEGPGPLEERGGFATQGWFIGLISAIVLLLLVLLILCFIKRSKGGKYSVKDKEEAHVDSEARPMKDETFGEYSDNEEKHSSASQPSLNGEVKPPGSDYSLADYGDSVDAQFNEDGSFIGQYSGRREGQGPGGHDSSGATSPVNPNHVGVPLE